MRESLSQQRQRVSDKVEFVWSDTLATVGGDGQGVSLGVDAEELQIKEAVGEPALRGMTHCHVSTLWQKLINRQDKGKKDLQPAGWLYCVALTASPGL